MVGVVDKGWVFYFSINKNDADKAWSILSAKIARTNLNADKIPATDFIGIRSKSYSGTVFIIRGAAQATIDIGIFAGEIEDAFRDANIQAGSILPDTSTIPGVKYTYYRNDTNLDGHILLPQDMQRLRRENKNLVPYNPYNKPDPWAEIYYEYQPSVEEITVSNSSATTHYDVDDFDDDLGSLLNSLFSGAAERHVTQPKGSKGWVFDKGYGRTGVPTYRFYGCSESIKPVRKTLAAAGIPYIAEPRGEWQCLMIPLASFPQAQQCLAPSSKLKSLNVFYLEQVKIKAQSTTTGASEDLLVSAL